MKTVIMAGAPVKGNLKYHTQVKYEALIKIGPNSMLNHVIQAVLQADIQGEIMVVGPKKVLNQKSVNHHRIKLLEAKSELLASLFSVFDRLDPDQFVLLFPCDIPLVTPEAINKFLYLAQQSEGDIFYPIIKRYNNEDLFPGMERTYLNLADGAVSGGNILLLKPKVLIENRNLVERVLQGRKKPWKLVKLLGVKFIFKYLINSLSISDVEQRIAELISFQGRIIELDYPEIGFDVDKEKDLKMINNLVKQGFLKNGKLKKI